MMDLSCETQVARTMKQKLKQLIRTGLCFSFYDVSDLSFILHLYRLG